MTTARTITTHEARIHRDALCAWAQANGLDPRDISADRPLTIEQRGDQQYLRYHRFERTADGHIQRDTSSSDYEVCTTEQTHRLTVPLPTLDEGPSHE